MAYDHEGEWWNCPNCVYQTTIQSLVHRQREDLRHGPRYRHRRADGWPYCPECDEDDLRAEDATEETIVGCDHCGWKP